jgi:putative spermidine/putrescine transport system ATP-binding protein
LSYLDVVQLSKRYGALGVLDRLDFAVDKGEFVALLGPSGCGKTTLLRLIAGLTAADGGTIGLDGGDITRTPAHRRRIGVVFQNYALFPHLTVADNVAFGLRAQRAPRAEIAPGVARALSLVQMTEFADRAVTALSGGQQQRVAVARALAVRPRLLLLDEPLSALDRKLREVMQFELRRLLRELAITAVFVTHDQEEAMVMSDRVAVMNRGAIEQFAPPRAIYDRPATAFALEFVGQSTRLRGRVVARQPDGVEVETALGRFRADGAPPPGDRVILAVRPERIALGGTGHNALRLPLSDMAFLGSKLMMLFATPPGDRVVVEASPADVSMVKAGDPVTLTWAPADTLLFPEG